MKATTADNSLVTTNKAREIQSATNKLSYKAAVGSPVHFPKDKAADCKFDSGLFDKTELEQYAGQQANNKNRIPCTIDKLWQLSYAMRKYDIYTFRNQFSSCLS